MYEIGKLIKNYLENQKIEFLEKKITQETREKKKKYEEFFKNKDKNLEDEKILKEKIKYDDSINKAREKFQSEADQKYDLLIWLKKSNNKSKPNITTHPAKFTNPKINKTTNLLFYGSKIIDGYVKTGNVILNSQIDVSGNAGTNTIIFELYNLLNLKLKDGIKLITLFENDNSELISFFNAINIEYEDIKAKCIDVFYGNDLSQITHEQIKQVYFPSDNQISSYHILSIVTPSMLMYETKNRIEAFDKWVDGNNIRKFKKINIYNQEGFDELIGLTEIGFSHTDSKKRGNVSYLNVKNKGIAYLLPSIPPQIENRKTRLPTTDFFKNSLSKRSYLESYQTLDRLINCGINNLKIRDGISNTLIYIIDQVMQRVFSIRATKAGWSNTNHYHSLPRAQRIWLDDAHLELRHSTEDWLEEICMDFARWIIFTYEYLCKNSYIQLSDKELYALRDIIEERLRDDQEFFK